MDEETRWNVLMRFGHIDPAGGWEWRAWMMASLAWWTLEAKSRDWYHPTAVNMEEPWTLA